MVTSLLATISLLARLAALDPAPTFELEHQAALLAVEDGIPRIMDLLGVHPVPADISALTLPRFAPNVPQELFLE